MNRVPMEIYKQLGNVKLPKKLPKDRLYFAINHELNLRVTNVVCTGKLPLKQKIDIRKIKEKSNLFWEIVNEEMCPILQTRISFNKKAKFNVHFKEKKACVSIWSSGAINIVGVTSLSQAKKAGEIVLKEIKRCLK